jgi:hypothetical protein
LAPARIHEKRFLNFIHTFDHAVQFIRSSEKILDSKDSRITVPPFYKPVLPQRMRQSQVYIGQMHPNSTGRSALMRLSKHRQKP